MAAQRVPLSAPPGNGYAKPVWSVRRARTQESAATPFAEFFAREWLRQTWAESAAGGQAEQLRPQLSMAIACVGGGRGTTTRGEEQTPREPQTRERLEPSSPRQCPLFQLVACIAAPVQRPAREWLRQTWVECWAGELPRKCGRITCSAERSA